MLAFTPADFGTTFDGDVFETEIREDVERIATAIVRVGVDIGEVRGRVNNLVQPIVEGGSSHLLDHLKSGLIADLINADAGNLWGGEADWSFEPEPEMPQEDVIDGSDPSGFVDISPSGSTPQDGLFVAEGDDQETQEVHQMLSSLSYVPAGWDSDDSTSGVAERFDSAASLVSDSVSSRLQPQTAEQPDKLINNLAEQLRATDPPLPSQADTKSGRTADGGLLPIERESLKGIPAAEYDDQGSLLETPVEMDKAQGKFQAFEVSTSEEIPVSAAPRNEDGAQLDRLLLPHGELPTIRGLDMNADSAADFVATGSSAMVDENDSEDTQPEVAIETDAARPLNVALAGAVVLAGHIVRTTYVRKPDDKTVGQQDTRIRS